MTKYYKYYTFTFFLLVAVLAGCRSTDLDSLNDGMPYGEITHSDMDHLMAFAKTQGVDLYPELKKAYAQDANALARVFQFSLSFKSLDQDARAYGHVIYSSLLNLGEALGPEQYSAVVLRQSPEVQQRVRDFVYYAVARLPKKVRASVDKEVREDFPILFPKDYKFGHDNPLFKKSALTRALQRTPSPPCVGASREFVSARCAPPPPPRPSLSLGVRRLYDTTL